MLACLGMFQLVLVFFLPPALGSALLRLYIRYPRLRELGGSNSSIKIIMKNH